MALHKNVGEIDIHAIVAFTFADATARNAGTGYTLTAQDLKKVAHQTDNNTFWVLTDESPITWVSLGGSAVTDGDKGDITVSGSGSTWAIDNDAVTDAKLRNSGATSVIGRAAGTSGDPSDIQASADGQVLKRSSGTLAFGTLAYSDLPTRTLTAGQGLTGGGDLSTDRTFNVVAADGSITVNADSIQVGTISDGNHGNRGGGSLHAVATPSTNGGGGTAGFMAAFDKEKVNNFKVPCVVATTANITLSGTQTIDGIAVNIGDRVLVRAQTTGSQNGIYDVAAGAWTRSFDAASTGDITTATVIQVKSGTAYNDIFFGSDTTPVIGTDPVVFVQMSGIPGTATPLGGSGSGVVGTGIKYAREDHQHPAITGLTDGDKGDITVSGSGTTWTIDNNTITDAKLRDSTATSVIGRSANSSGDPSDIQASADGQFLRRASGALAFGALAYTDLPTRTLTAGAGLTGGGDLSADRTFNVVAADGSIVVNADSIQVGTITAANHGNQTSGSLHAETVASVGGSGGTAGFQAPLDKEKLDQFKIPVTVATTANITLSGTQTIDGVGVVAGQRVLVKSQSTATENGIYDCAAGAWTRSFDANTTGELTPDTVVMVKEGTVSANHFYCLANTTVPTLGSDAVNWTLLSSPVDSTTPSTVGTANSTGTSIKSSRADHVHAHGNQTSGSLHAITVPSVNGAGGTAGFLAAFDKEKLDQFKVVCAAATTGNITLSGTQTVDGVSLVASDRCLVKNQTTQSENGIYDVAAGAWTRSFDANTTGQINPGLVVMVKSGTTNDDIFFTSNTTPVIGTDPVVFVQLSGIPATTTPSSVTTAGAVGTSVKFARADHAHDIANDAVTYAKMQNVSAASRVLGRGSAGGSGDTEELTLGTGLTMTGTVLSSSVGISLKLPCRVATTANITLSGTQTIDGVGVVAGERVLVKNQSTASQNGIYDCAAGAWARSSDMAVSADLQAGTAVVVTAGTVGADTVWELQTDGAITLGSTNLTFICIGGQAATATPANIGTAAVGTSNLYARQDHVHNIASNYVTRAMLVNGAATTVIGRSANSSGAVADIAAATNGHVLKRSGTTATLNFGEAPGIYTFHGGDLLVPGTGWNITAIAPTSLDSSDAYLQVARFDDTTEEGRGWYCFIPAGAQEMKITYLSRAQTAPAGARTVGAKLSYKRLQHNTALPAWATHTLTDVAIPASALWQVQSQTFAFTAPTTALVAGEFYVMELSRPNPVGGTELVGDWVLHQLKVEFF